MSEFSIDVWTIVIGILCNVSCALIGCYLVLRRMSLLGDAISHAVLPGIVVAFVFFESRASLPMFLGAMGMGVLTAFLTQTVHRFANVSEDTSMGAVFTTLFALGVLLINVVPGLANVDLDPDCVFQGSIEYEAVDRLVFLGLMIPRAVPVLGAVLLANLAFISLLWKELKLATFDPALSTSLGFNSGLLFYLVMAAVAGTTVAAFWSVGSILVIAMLIVPAATAELLTHRLGVLLLLAALAAALASVFGYLLADWLATSVAGMMAVVVGVQYAFAMMLAPRHGVLMRWAHRFTMTLRIVCEDILAAIYRWEEDPSSAAMPLESAMKVGGSGWICRVGVWRLRWRGDVMAVAGGLRLSAAGRSLAAHLVRSHRLWESYLAEHVGLPSDHLHEPAMRMEHFMTREIERELVRGLVDSRTDPHGRPIPGKPVPAPDSQTAERDTANTDNQERDSR